jgi:hypothetical protein
MRYALQCSEYYSMHRPAAPGHPLPHEGLRTAVHHVLRSMQAAAALAAALRGQAPLQAPGKRLQRCQTAPRHLVPGSQSWQRPRADGSW